MWAIIIYTDCVLLVAFVVLTIIVAISVKEISKSIDEEEELFL